MGPAGGVAMERKYRVVVVGVGKRGMHHATAFQANGRFELVGLCDIDQGRVDAAAAKLGVKMTGTDARRVAAEERPDVFCVCTLPGGGAGGSGAGIAGGGRLMAMEKPVALTSAEGFEIRKLLDSSGVKAVVSHQNPYREPHPEDAR